MKKLNTRFIVKSFNDLCNDLSNRYDINCGGCCFVASEIAKYLDKLGIKYELRVYDHCGKDETAINNEVRTKHRNNSSSKSVVGMCSCCHYFLYVEGAGSINEESDYYSDYKRYSISNINHRNIRWIYKVSVWNDCYDTSNNSIIKKIIKSYFYEHF